MNNHVIAETHRNTHTEHHGRLSKTSACCRHGDIDISGKTPKMKLLYQLLCYFGIWVFTQLTKSLGFFCCIFSPLFSPLPLNTSGEMLMTSVSSRLCCGAPCASKTDSPASPKTSLWITEKSACRLKSTGGGGGLGGWEVGLHHCCWAAASSSSLSEEPQFANVQWCRCKWLMTASFVPKSIHEMIFFFPGCCLTNAIIRQLTHCQQGGIENPLFVQASEWSQSGYLCVCVFLYCSERSNKVKEYGIGQKL